MLSKILHSLFIMFYSGKMISWPASYIHEICETIPFESSNPSCLTLWISNLNVISLFFSNKQNVNWDIPLIEFNIDVPFEHYAHLHTLEHTQKKGCNI